MGLLSLLCVKYLRAAHVTATDGDEAVLDAFKENAFLNGLDEESKLESHVLQWGHDLRGALPDTDPDSHGLDLILGADIVGAGRVFAICTADPYPADLRQNGSIASCRNHVDVVRFEA